MPLLNLSNQPIVLVDLFMINIAAAIFYFRFIFSVYSTLFFKLILIIFSPGLCSWRYHRWCLAGTQPLVCSVYCFLCCNFYVVIKKKKRLIRKIFTQLNPYKSFSWACIVEGLYAGGKKSW